LMFAVAGEAPEAMALFELVFLRGAILRLFVSSKIVRCEVMKLT
jgi:hypothetical protein